MRKIKKKKETVTELPPLYDTVMRLGESRDFLRVPACPSCKVQKTYGRYLSRGPVCRETCSHCGEEYECYPGARSLILALVLVAVCVLMCRAVMTIATDIVPLFVLTMIFVIGAWFLWPLTLSTRKKKRK
ncbi:MAG: hypothetical protein IJY28_06860 [Clostridia bacterium]|nr:hypothetical protein [Clostridia bacterium]